MALTVANVLSATAIDARQVLNASTDSGIMIDWVNRINKDVMHNSVYNNLLTAVAAGTYTGASTLVTVALTTPRRVLGVFDKVWNRPLIPVERSVAPAPAGEQQGPIGIPPSAFDRYEKQKRPNQIPNIELQATSNTAVAMTILPYPWPEYYTYGSGSNVYVYPVPVVNSSVGCDVIYEKYTTNLTGTGDSLDVPDDGKDVVVAGVNMLMSAYLKRFEDANFWKAEYLRMLQGSGLV